MADWPKKMDLTTHREALLGDARALVVGRETREVVPADLGRELYEAAANVEDRYAHRKLGRWPFAGHFVMEALRKALTRYEREVGK